MTSKEHFNNSVGEEHQNGFSSGLEPLDAPNPFVTMVVVVAVVATATVIVGLVFWIISVLGC